MTSRIRNVYNKKSLGHPEMDRSHPYGAEVTFDGQTYFIGPNERMSLMNDAIANSLVTMSAYGVPNQGGATVAHDTGSFSTEQQNTFRA